MARQPRQFRPSTWKPKVERERESDARRGTAAARGYDGAWSAAAIGHRRNDPLCRYCRVGAFGPAVVKAATLVDHFIPHRGDRVLFWDRRLWVSSCTDCHSGPKQAIERQGTLALRQLARKVGIDLSDVALPAT